MNPNKNNLSLEKVLAVARDGQKVDPLSRAVKEAMDSSSQWIQDVINEGKTIVYGVNTGFGPLASQQIPADQTRQLSQNLILSCLVGVGAPLPVDVVRAMMLIRANSLAKGFSGVRPVVVQTLIEMLNAGVTPYVPRKGSLGASGDLAPLSHMACVLIRGADEEAEDYSGQAWLNGQLMSGAEAMGQAGIKRITLEAKEGLALSNGTSFMAAIAALTILDAENLIRHAEIAAALSMEALAGISDAFQPALHEVNNQPGQIKTAANLRKLLSGSKLIDSDPERIQDAYSLRCTPQVLGPTRDILIFLRERVTAAINAATDNPLIFMELTDDHPTKTVSGGNFHGEGLAIWLDFLSITLASLGNISERRTFRLLTPELSGGLPAMLVPNPGLDSGLMMPQYTAAALVSENKTLAHPDSVDSIPSSGNQEDFVSMGANAALHAMEISENLHYIIAIELLTAAQGIDLRQKLAPATLAAYRELREKVQFLEKDRQLTPDIEALASLIRSGKILKAVQKVVGEDF
jgi:histidine ammonia-lyase